MGKLVFVCLFGGQSSEYEVSLVSAYGVITNTDREKYDLYQLGITKDGRWYLYTGAPERIRDGLWNTDTEHLVPARIAPGSRLLTKKDEIHIDVAFPVMHGAFGEDGRMQGLLESYGVPFVGPGCASSAVCMDKAFAKRILDAEGIPQAKAVILTRRDMKEDPAALAARLEKELGYPMFVKPANAGSSVGISKVRDESELRPALELAFAEDNKLLVEECIVGKEVECAVMGNDELIVADPGEIDPGAEFYDYDTKYKTDTSRCYIPARVSVESRETVRRLAAKIFRALGCRGLSRVDFFVCPDGKVIFNEINTLPGFTPISMYPKMMMHEGMTYSEVIDRLLALAMEGK